MTIATKVARAARPAAPAEVAGRSFPLGTTVVEGGVNFSLYSRTASGVELVFFDREDDATPSRVVRLDPATNRTYYYWHAFVPDLSGGQIYGYRVDGASDPARGLRSDRGKVLLDPYARGVVDSGGRHRPLAIGPGGPRPFLSGRAPFGRDAVRGRSARGQPRESGQAEAPSREMKAMAIGHDRPLYVPTVQRPGHVLGETIRTRDRANHAPVRIPHARARSGGGKMSYFDQAVRSRTGASPAGRP